MLQGIFTINTIPTTSHFTQTGTSRKLKRGLSHYGKPKYGVICRNIN